MNKTHHFSALIQYSFALFFGIISALWLPTYVIDLAAIVSDLFMRLLQLVSLPIIFLSIVTVASSMQEAKGFTLLLKRVISLTLITTVVAATVALLLFSLIVPVQQQISVPSQIVFEQTGSMTSYWTHLLKIIPSNFFAPFVENNVMGVLVIAFLCSAGSLAIPLDERRNIHKVFSSLYAIFMKITSWIVKVIPIALWAFITMFVVDVQKGLQVSQIGAYLLCVVGANTVQAFIVLPLFLRIFHIKVLPLAKAMFPALTVAFFTKSSTATIPTAIRSAQERADISSRVANFAFPLCTTINMNGCAAFILTTVLFVSMLHGVTYTFWEYILWIFVSTLAAVGNAGVPMGCYFLSTAFLAAMNVPITIMGAILPFYALIDAYETAVNVWSDSCVAAICDKTCLENNELEINSL